MKDEAEIAHEARIAEIDLRLRSMHLRIASILGDAIRNMSDLNRLAASLRTDTHRMSDFFDAVTLEEARLAGTYDRKIIESVCNDANWPFEKKFSEELSLMEQLHNQLITGNNRISHQRAHLAAQLI